MGVALVIGINLTSQNTSLRQPCIICSINFFLLFINKLERVRFRVDRRIKPHNPQT